MSWIPFLAERWIPDGDVIFATAWHTAEWVVEYSRAKGAKYYLIQGLETFDGPVDRVMSTWKLPLHKVVTSAWLQDIATKFGEPAYVVPLGLDFSAFGVDTPTSGRSPTSILMLYHSGPWKGSSDGLEALKRVQSDYPQLRLTLFGVPAKPQGLPTWATYVKNPDQSTLRSLYNEASIFVSPSLQEGWGLPACEAMLCGCAIAATDIGGHRAFAENGVSALLSPPGDHAALARNIRRLIEDKDLRLRLARTGHLKASRLSWDTSVRSLERVVSGLTRLKPRHWPPDHD